MAKKPPTILEILKDDELSNDLGTSAESPFEVSKRSSIVSKQASRDTLAKAASSSSRRTSTVGSDLKDILDSVNETQTTAIISLAKRLNKGGDNIELQVESRLSGIFNAEESLLHEQSDAFQCSEDTKDLSSQLKEQFTQKYGNLDSALKDGKQYNPLEYLRKRQQDEKKQFKTNKPKNTWKLEAKEVAAAVKETQKSPEETTEKKKRGWKFFSVGRKKDHAEKDESKSFKSIDERSGDEILDNASLRSKSQRSETSSIHSKNFTESALKQEEVHSRPIEFSPPGMDYGHKRGISLNIPVIKKDPELILLSPTSQTSDSDFDDKSRKKKRRNIQKFTERFIKRSESNESFEDSSPERVSLDINEETRRRMAIQPERRKLIGKNSNMSMKSSDNEENQTIKHYKYLKNIALFESTTRPLYYDDEKPYIDEDDAVHFVTKPNYARERLVQSQRCIYEAVDALLAQRLAEMSVQWADMSEKASRKFQESVDPIASDQAELARRRDMFYQQLNSLSSGLGILLREDIHETEQQQAEMAEDINRAIRQLAALSDEVNSNLVPTLNRLKAKAGDLVVTNRNNMLQGMTEVGYTALAMLLKGAGTVFWAGNLVYRGFRRVLGYQDAPRARENSVSSDVSEILDFEVSPSRLSSRRQSVFHRRSEQNSPVRS